MFFMLQIRDLPNENDDGDVAKKEEEDEDGQIFFRRRYSLIAQVIASVLFVNVDRVSQMTERSESVPRLAEEEVVVEEVEEEGEALEEAL